MLMHHHMMIIDVITVHAHWEASSYAQALLGTSFGCALH
jgi:hypothetical protein